MAGIRWEAPEFEHRPKTATWYWMTIAVAVALLALSIWQRSFLFGLFIVLAEILLIVWAAENPPTVQFELTERGIKIGSRKFYPMREISYFSADIDGLLDEAYPEIVLNFHHHFRLPLRIKAPARWLPEIRKELRNHVREEHFDPGFTELLEHYLGF